MRRRWYYWKRWVRSRISIVITVCTAFAVCFLLFVMRKPLSRMTEELFEKYGVQAAAETMKRWFPWDNAEKSGMEKIMHSVFGQAKINSVNETCRKDPAYARILLGKRTGSMNETSSEEKKTRSVSEEDSGETVSVKTTGTSVFLEKLADYDYLMKNFYVVHPTTTAERTVMNAENFLSMDLSIEKNPEEPQILIYHTHSQEEFSDYPENPGATIVGVGEYLKELLEKRGYSVIHDSSTYDMQGGKLDRSQAYTYALDGITGILQKYPSIEVVLDIHRDGVDKNTRLVTEIDGKQTAKIMFFNGTSQTPDGPIEYLKNPNSEANLAFSFQMQLASMERYPDFTRKIYLKGLRYNQHVRARSALIEVGAQTNTYAEALQAMEPLTEILCEVLEPD